MTDPIPDPDQVVLIPLDEIDADALARDRAGLDDDELMELRTSIARSGLRMPIEVFPLEGEPLRYAIISGYRRFAAFRELREINRRGAYAAIPAFVRAPASIAAAYASMVEENAVRAELSPWEQGAIAVTARDRGVFASLEEAVDGLYVSASSSKRARLRTLARLVEEMVDELAAPQTWSLRQCLRVAAALAKGYGDLMRHALRESREKTGPGQWSVLLPILIEAETADPIPPKAKGGRVGHPRRLSHPRQGLNIWREQTPNGWRLNFTGREARGELIDLVFDEIERMFGPA